LWEANVKKKRGQIDRETIIYMLFIWSRDVISPKAQEHFSRDSCSGRLWAHSPPDFYLLHYHHATSEAPGVDIESDTG
jgi:hypothetical protein